MAAIENLFRIRTAEQAQGDSEFLALFSGRVVKALPATDVWDRLVRIESAPGGGKTSLLRLFTPMSLARIYRTKNTQGIKELYRELVELGAIEEEQGPAVLGVLVNCHHDYSRIAEHGLDQDDKIVWFMSLLDARTTLLVLRAALQLAGLRYPHDVDRLTLVRKAGGMPGPLVDDEIAGRELFEECRGTEQRIAAAVNRLGAPRRLEERRTRLEVARLLTSHEVRIDGKPLVQRVLLMFDETHTLEEQQRQALGQDLTSHDVGVARWMAMRLTALTPAEAMSETAIDGREYRKVRLEDWNASRAERWLADIADKRAIQAVSAINAFETLLAEGLETETEVEKAAHAASEERRTAIELVDSHAELFRDWVNEAESQSAQAVPLDAAIFWSRLKILAARRLRRRQPEFDFASIPTTQIDTGVTVLETAKLFVSYRHGLPYYYGKRKILQLGSGNAQQFLQVAGDLFEAMIYAGILTEPSSRQLSARQQDRIVRRISRQTLDRVRHELPDGNDVHALLSAAGQLAKAESHRPTAPYAPGVTGFALSMSDRDKLLAADAREDQATARLRRALHAAIAHNLLTPFLDRQAKGGAWMVLYLNRLLCPAFDLPLGQGGYRDRSLAELKIWVHTGVPSSLRRTRLHD